MDFLELADVVERAAPPELGPNNRYRADVRAAHSMFEAEGFHMSEDEGVATLIRTFVLDSDNDNESKLVESLGRTGGEEDVEESDYDKSLPLEDRTIRWFLKRLIKRVAITGARMMIKALWRLVSWFAKEVVIGAFRMAGRFIARYLIVEGAAALLAAPELAVLGGAAAAAVLGGLGYYIYRRYFEGPSAGDYNPEQLREEAINFGQQTTAPTSSAPVYEPPAGGPVQYATAPKAAGGVQVAPLTGNAPAVGPGKKYAKGEVRRFKDLIARGEGDYNSVNYGATHKYRSGHEDLVHMTLAEVQQHQHNRDFNAAGRYQIMGYPSSGDTLGFAIKALNLDTSQLFDERMQDMIFDGYLANKKHPQIEAYLSGRSDNLWGAVLAVSQEWASVAAPAGAELYNPKHKPPIRISDGTQSYYSGTANNKASISADEMAASLQQERAIRTGTTVNSDTPEAKPSTTVTPPAVTAHAGGSNQGGTNETSGHVQKKDTTIIIGPKGVPVKLK